VAVDEGQRLKSGPKGLLFQALNSLNIGQRILLSGEFTDLISCAPVH
jgi:hypothetical protein